MTQAPAPAEGYGGGENRVPWSLLALATSIVFGTALMDWLTTLPDRVVFSIPLAVLPGGMMIVKSRSSAGVWSAASIYLAIYGVFHFGLTSSVALDLPLADEFETIMAVYWPKGDAVRHAVLSATLGAIAFVSGVLLIRSQQTGSRRPFTNGNALYDDIALARGGLLLLVAAIGAWFFRVVSVGGSGILFASYGAFLEATRTENLSGLYFAVGLGLSMASAAAGRHLKIASYGIFGIWAFTVLPLGLRGEVLFALAAAAAVMARRRSMPSGRNAIVVAVVVLGVIAAIRVGRREGFAVSGASIVDLAPQNGLAEMGGSIWPVAEVIAWQASGEDPLYGATYWAPLDRALYYIIPGWSRPEAESDDRLSNIVIQRRVGAIGFSPVAEAYRNFGDIGVVVFMLAVGAVLGVVGRWPDTPRSRMAIGAILFPLLVFVRNDFTPVPAQLGLGLGYSALVVATMRPKRGPEART